MTTLDRVVLFHDFSEALGGASYLVQVLIEQLRERDIPLSFLAGDSGEKFAREDVDFHSLGEAALLEKSAVKAATTGLYNKSLAAMVSGWVAKNDTPGTVYHVHGWSKILSPSLFAALSPVRQRLVLHAHDYFLGCPNGGYFNFQKGEDCRLTPLSAACVASQCDKASFAQKTWRVAREGVRRRAAGPGGPAARTIAIHPGMIEHLARGGTPLDRLHAVRNPVTPFLPERVEAEKNKEIVFVGRISAEKGADLAAAAAAKAGVPITFIGDGAEEEKTKVLAVNPAATMAGWLPREEAAKRMRSARLSVMPSRWSEPFGLVALEAIGSGVPAIVTDRALIAADLEQHGLGVGVDVRDMEAFAAVLKTLSAADDRVAAMSTRGVEGYLDVCNTPAGWADALVAHYNAVLEGAALKAAA